MSTNNRPSQLDMSIIILAWNSAIDLPRCLTRLSLQRYDNFEIIILDNGSEDGALDGLQDNFPSLNLHIHRLSSNQGFSIANNLGARLAQGKYLVLLNADAFRNPIGRASCWKPLKGILTLFFPRARYKPIPPIFWMAKAMSITSADWRGERTTIFLFIH